MEALMEVFKQIGGKIFYLGWLWKTWFEIFSRCFSILRHDSLDGTEKGAGQHLCQGRHAVPLPKGLTSGRIGWLLLSSQASVQPPSAN